MKANFSLLIALLPLVLWAQRTVVVKSAADSIRIPEAHIFQDGRLVTP